MVVTKCLDLASQRGYATVALPALGTGNLGYPHNIVAQTMLGAVDRFLQTNPSTSLKEVRIVVYHTDKKCLQVTDSGTLSCVSFLSLMMLRAHMVTEHSCVIDKTLLFFASLLMFSVDSVRYGFQVQQKREPVVCPGF